MYYKYANNYFTEEANLVSIANEDCGEDTDNIHISHGHKKIGKKKFTYHGINKRLHS